MDHEQTARIVHEAVAKLNQTLAAAAAAGLTVTLHAVGHPHHPERDGDVESGDGTGIDRLEVAARVFKPT